MAGIIGIVSFVSSIIAFIMLINLIQRAFENEGVVWGVLAMMYPPGTYLFCRRNWENNRKQFITIGALLLVSLVLLLVLKLITHHQFK